MLQVLQKKQVNKALKLSSLEVKNWSQLPYNIFLGTDEVGRGCLAGPVVSACVVYLKDFRINSFNTDKINLSRQNEVLEKVKDSKLLSEVRREELSGLIMENFDVGIGYASVDEIEKINILNASLLSMKRSVDTIVKKCINWTNDSGWNRSESLILLDGNKVIPSVNYADQAAVIKGDQLVSLISAASIVAKVYRDRWMKRISLEYPEYKFEVHKGYSTQLHRDYLKKFGVSPWHRKTFRGVKEYVL